MARVETNTNKKLLFVDTHFVSLFCEINFNNVKDIGENITLPPSAMDSRTALKRDSAWISSFLK